MIHSYSSIFTLGHRAVKDLLNVPVIIEEKIDGSQLSFMRQGDTVFFRSKSAEIDPEHPPKLFAPAVEYIKSIGERLTEGWVYRGEAVCSPRHNVLKYNRCPEGFVIIYDVECGLYDYLPYIKKRSEALRIGLECVSLVGLHTPETPLTQDNIETFLQRESALGGPPIEGMVFKPTNYNLFGEDKKVIMGKYVSEAFKEIHRKEWRSLHNPSRGDIIQSLASGLATEARWNKAVQHLREANELEDSPRDIGKLIKEIQADVEKETKDEIMERLWKWAWPQLNRKVVSGFPEYYKKSLLEKQFKDSNETVE